MKNSLIENESTPEGGRDVENQKKNLLTIQSPKMSNRSGDSYIKLQDRKVNQSVLSKDPNDPDDFSPFEAF